MIKAEGREQLLEQQQLQSNDEAEQDTVWLKLPMSTSIRAEIEGQKKQDPAKPTEEDPPPAITTSRPNRRRTSGFVSQLTTASLANDDDAAATSTSTSKGLRRTSLSSALDAARSSTKTPTPDSALGKSRSNESITFATSDDFITVEKKVVNSSNSRRASSVVGRGVGGKKAEEKEKAFAKVNAGTGEGKENDLPLAVGKKEKLAERQNRVGTRRRSIM